MDYYRNTSYWKKYSAFLPEELQYKDSRLPQEEYWQWRHFNIHLDAMRNGEAAVKIIILHGAGGNGRIIGLFGNFLNSHGYEYIAPDLPGYGLTANQQKSNFEYSQWVDCISDLIDEELLKDPRPIVLFGLSMGGMLAYQAAAKNKKVKGIIATTLADPRLQPVRDDLAKYAWQSRLGMPLLRIFKELTDSLSVPIKWLCKMERITNDSQFSKVFAEDPLAGGSKIKLRFLRTFMDFTPAIEPEEFSAAPLLFLQPAKDAWTAWETSRPFYNRLNCQKKMVILDNCGHAPYEQPGVSVMRNEILQFLKTLHFT
ncbi:MAG: alpha/beta hydrolase [Flavobacterium sp.]|uniref:alpha/beta hydrolase n=1 Tax=Flavobacterium sp. TaxID=239 RepID=UPI001B0E6024|nr:alpha/beta hydrolase [Flavobacterium sp.]MBO9586520.1 alpha/beta hydrolase [Flavobacterium sp.]